MTQLTPLQTDAIGRAAYLQEDIQRFQSQWPCLNAIHDLAPQFTWNQLERQLSSLSANPASSAIIHDLVSATRKQARFKPTEMVLREILCIASAVMDETFQATPEHPDCCSPDLEEGPMR